MYIPDIKKPKGLTLVELLVTLSIIAVLSTLLAVAVVSAKKRSKSISCKNNLRQQGLWLTDFVSENSVYPLAMNTNSARYPAHATSWTGSLRNVGGFSSVIQSGDQGDVFDCPSASTPPDLQGNEGFTEYGYNSDGIIGRVGDGSLGLGGHGGEGGDLFAPPVAGTAVASPTDMIAIGDAFMGWGGKIMDGRNSFIGLRAGIDVGPKETRRALNRHSGSANYLFCDGHVDQFKLADLFLNPNSGRLRHWTRDNVEHRERVW